MRLLSDVTYRFSEWREVERELAVVERLMVAHALLDRRDLDLRLGDRTVGDFTVTVQRPTQELYRISVTRGATDRDPDLETLVHRPLEASR